MSYSSFLNITRNAFVGYFLHWLYIAPTISLVGEDVFPRLFIADTTSSVPLHISRYAHVVKFEVSSFRIYIAIYPTSS
nr:MAG TPA: hypothetical protein [Caudoviricetes sp.]